MKFVNVLFFNLILLSHHFVFGRNWHHVLERSFPKFDLGGKISEIRHVENKNYFVDPAKNWISKREINVCLEDGKRLYEKYAEIEKHSAGKSFQSPSLRIFFTAMLTPEIESASKRSKEMLLSTKILQNRINTCNQMTPNTFLTFLESNKFSAPKTTNLYCPLYNNIRSYDGSCNNILNPLWGAAYTPYTRIALPNYNDGIYEMAKAKSGNALPSPRVLSNTLFQDKDKKYNNLLSNMAAFWGQFVAHDLSLRIMEQNKDSGIQCCSKDGCCEVNQDGQPDACAPISVPSDDPFYSNEGIRCLNFVRSITAPAIDNTLGPAQQMNIVSNFLDGSTVYSSKTSSIKKLRAFEEGKLELTSKELLLSSPDPENMCDGSTSNGQCPCYIAGDLRINQTPPLVVIHTIFAREHNRIAKELKKINPHWDDERLFQESRKIVIAEIQHITYQEWLPICIGKEYTTKNKISPIGLFSYDYDMNVNPGIINAFATAAFRFFHTLINGYVTMCPGESRQQFQHSKLSQHLLNPHLVELDKNGLDSVLRGVLSEPAMDPDAGYSSEIRNFLFKSNNSSGMDLASIDIQRNRDHGLANYNTYRSICGLNPASTFEDLSGEISPDRIDLLKSLYECVDDIDLFVGGSMETKTTGSILGPTFQCIVGEQFYRTRVGDKYFYDRADVQHSFTPSQLKEIKKVSLSRIICDNSNIEYVQSRAFEIVCDYNPLCNCCNVNKLPTINLKYWKEYK